MLLRGSVGKSKETQVSGGGSGGERNLLYFQVYLQKSRRVHFAVLTNLNDDFDN